MKIIVLHNVENIWKKIKSGRCL